jgi:hypothetical protein
MDKYHELLEKVEELNFPEGHYLQIVSQIKKLYEDKEDETSITLQLQSTSARDGLNYVRFTVISKSDMPNIVYQMQDGKVRTASMGDFLDKIRTYCVLMMGVNFKIVLNDVEEKYTYKDWCYSKLKNRKDITEIAGDMINEEDIEFSIDYMAYTEDVLRTFSRIIMLAE